MLSLSYSFALSFDTGYMPRVSIITSVYKADDFMRSFLEDITQQTIFDQCELIIINANSPGNEEAVIYEYLKKYSNIVYKRLDKDPGLFGVWNLGIKMAKSLYVTNANVDDRFKFDCYEVHANYLDAHPDIDLVYSGCYITRKPNETFCKNSSGGEVVWHSQQEFDRIKQLYGVNKKGSNPIPYVNNHPVWRKSLHKKYGLFDENYKATGGLEFWIRATICGNAQFKKIDGIYSLYYWNPKGISSKIDSLDAQEKEKIVKLYRLLYENIFSHISFLD